jgi:hypothetical protein
VHSSSCLSSRCALPWAALLFDLALSPSPCPPCSRPHSQHIGTLLISGLLQRDPATWSGRCAGMSRARSGVRAGPGRLAHLGSIAHLASSGAAASRNVYGTWEQCGGLGSCSPQYCADAPWSNSRACPAGTRCFRRSSSFWACAPEGYAAVASPPPLASPPLNPPGGLLCPSGLCHWCAVLRAPALS